MPSESMQDTDTNGKGCTCLVVDILKNICSRFFQYIRQLFLCFRENRNETSVSKMSSRLVNLSFKSGGNCLLFMR